MSSLYEINQCAYEDCYNPRDPDLSSTGVQSYLCGYHRQNEGVSVESVVDDHRRKSANSLRNGINGLLDKERRAVMNELANTLISGDYDRTFTAEDIEIAIITVIETNNVEE